MPELAPEQEQQIIDDLTALEWTRDLNARSVQVISDRLGCPVQEATRILEQLEAKNLIESVSESGGTPAANRPMDSYGWKWERIG